MSMMANMFREEQARVAAIGFCLGGMATGVLVGYPLGGLFYAWFGKKVLFNVLIWSFGLLLGKQLFIHLIYPDFDVLQSLNCWSSIGRQRMHRAITTEGPCES